MLALTTYLQTPYNRVKFLNLSLIIRKLSFIKDRCPINERGEIA